MARYRSDSPLLFDILEKPDFSIEARAIASSDWPVAGIDEVGRGPLAGPVVAAAVILNPDCIPDGLDDSKRLTAQQRERLFDSILDSALAISLASIAAQQIDRMNILQSSLEAMRRAFSGLSMVPRLALVDGRDVPPGLCCAARALVKGDRRSLSIAAASIIAKVTRDRMMEYCGLADHRYGFEKHMGYATQQHRQAIALHGPVARWHRMSFSPLKPEE